MNLKKIISFLLLNSSLLICNALPGFPAYIQELPGQYVYYEDKTFERKSYLGILQFDEKTFAARYFAPADTKNKKPKADVEIYFTIDPKADHLEMTGERIMSGFSPEEAEFVNYIHDMLYEMSSRRIKLGALSENKKVVRNNEHFPQFGGFVTVEYDAIVPLFNIKTVFSEESSPDLFIVTAGQLTSSTDRSFEQFSGFPEKHEDINHTMPKAKKTSAKTFSTSDGKTFKLDTNWTQSMDNVFMLGDAALLSTGTIPSAPVDFLIRQLMLSTGDSYLNWQKTEIIEKNETISISGVYFQPSTGNISKNFKFASKKSKGYDFVTLTVFENLYEKNRKYFYQIFKDISSQ